MFIKEKKFCRKLCILFAAIFIFFSELTAQTSSLESNPAEVADKSEDSQKALLTKEKSRMFWKITGKDKNGNPSVVYIQGTLHIGNENLFPLDKEVLDAFNGADLIVAEISDEDMSNIALKSMRLVQESFIKAGGKKISEGLSKKEIQALNELMESPMVLARMDLAEPWVISLVLLGKAVQETSELSSEYSIDGYFYKLAKESGRKVNGLDDLKAQFDIITFGTYEQQLIILKAAIKECSDKNCISNTKMELQKLYEAYLSGDEDKMALVSENSNENDYKEYGDFGEEYKKLVYDKRNEDWAKDIKTFLENGGTSFIYAGCAHWVGKKSVFEYLRAQGTIE